MQRHLTGDEYPIVSVSNGSIIVKDGENLLKRFSIDQEKGKLLLQSQLKLSNLVIEPLLTCRIPCGDDKGFFCLNIKFPQIGMKFFVRFNNLLEMVNSITVNGAGEARGLWGLKFGGYLFESIQLAHHLGVEAQVEKSNQWKTRMNHMFEVSFEEGMMEYLGSFEQTFGSSAAAYIRKCLYSVEDDKDVLVRYQFE